MGGVWEEEEGEIEVGEVEEEKVMEGTDSRGC